MTPALILRWWYDLDAQPYEFFSPDSGKIGSLYRLKVLEPSIVKVSVCLDDLEIISYTRHKDDGE